MIGRSPTLLAALVLTVGALLATACGSDATVVPNRSDTTDTAASVADAGQPTEPVADESGPTESGPTESADAVQAESQASEPEQDQAEPAPTNGEDEPADTADTPAPTSAPEPVGRPAAPNGRVAPDVATRPSALADQVAQAERGLADPATTPERRAEFGHLHQVAIRKLGYNPDWDIPFFEALPSELQARTLLHVSVRRALIDLSSGYDAADFIPAWEIVNPEPADALVSYYKSAEDATGIEWEYLAAINLVETGMGRIRGLSSAGAQGPMQFLPTTWAESGIGEGDINDPNDAIAGAARYLVRRGGPADMPGAIWGYNNSDDYVTAVQAYAALLRQDPAAYEAIYNWEIYFFTEDGDVWLPSGFRSEESVDLDDFLVANPWSAPDPGLR